VRVGRLPLVPPAPLRREDRRGGKDVGKVTARPRGGGERVRGRDVLGHQPHGRHAPAEHLFQVFLRFRVDVRVDQARHDPLSRRVPHVGAAGKLRDRRGGRNADRDDPAALHDEEGVGPRRRARSVDERRAAKSENRGQEGLNGRPLPLFRAPPREPRPGTRR
jgi:hypothetical protein